MIHKLSKPDLKMFADQPSGVAVSLYMPTVQAGAETQQNPIRYKNLVREIETRLTALELESAAVQTVLEPFQPLLEDDDFWQHQSHGLAILRDSNLFKVYCLPVAFDELVVVSEQFHIKPLLSYLMGDGRFYVLALSQNAVRMLECTRDHAREIELDQVPQGLADTLRYHDPEQQLQFHTGTTGGQGNRAAIYHGQGGGKDVSKAYLLEYFRQVDRGLHDILRDEQTPLVLAGVEYLQPIYREANTYGHLIESGITGNPDYLAIDALHERAWPLVEPIFLRAQEEAAAKYKQYAGSEQASDDLSAIVPAAYFGRIDTLFVALDIQQWGRFDRQTATVTLDDEEGEAAEDLLNAAALHTFLNGGSVYAVEPGAVPSSRSIAAVYRYS